MKKIIYYITIGIAIGIIIMQTIFYFRIKKIENQDILFKVVITEDFINVRSQPTTTAEKIYEVVKGESYEVIETFEELEGEYVWYKIIFSDRRVGWIASEIETSWVKIK